ncbi:CHAT domain-containing protein [Streptomyces sp. NPDC008137]|uniref:CHAT domain-containing protein n=1 Tax=Streptomyces sp. NPDC008137 TaxID=3364813 RepID=UPI0036F155C2
MADDTAKGPVEAELRVVGGDGYTVWLSTDGGLVASAPLGGLSPPEELTKLFDRGVADTDRAQAGEQLYTALLGGDLAPHWAALRTAAAPSHRVLRIRLEISPPELRPLPWELLRDRNQWLWRRPELRWRRGVADRSEAPDVVRELGPLRVLVVVCNPPHDDRVLAEQELAVISGALERSPGLTHLEVLDAPRDAAELSRRIDRLRPHVVHFIGHGMPRPGSGSPVLAFVPAEGGADDWELAAESIADLTTWKPMLVVINACHAGKADPADWIGGMAQAFLDAQTRAVVSMQDDVASDAAVDFSAKFYEELGASRPLDDAVAAARSELARRVPATGAWALPVLLTSSAPDQVLPVDRLPPPGTSLTDAEKCRWYMDLGRFVGRSDERRRAWWALDDPTRTPNGTDRPVLVIGGHSQTNSARTGKSWLTNWCLITWFLRGHRVVSVNLAARLRPGPGIPDSLPRTQHKDWLSALRLIRQEATSPTQLCRLPDAAFGHFNAVLNHLVGAATLPPDELEPAEDDWQQFDDEIGDPYDKRKTGIMDAFLDALRTAAAGQPLVLALDQAENLMPGAFTDVLYQGLIRPVAYDHGAPLRLIVVAPDAWLSGKLPETDAHMLGRVSVDDFDSAQFMRLARAYAFRLGVPPDEQIEAVLESIQKTLTPHFGVETFERLTDILPVWCAARARTVLR